MMTDISIDNINRILTSEISRGHNVVGLLSVDDNNHLLLCWRTNDTKVATDLENVLKDALHGDSNRELIKLPKEA